jgi:hypothetical protein
MLQNISCTGSGGDFNWYIRSTCQKIYCAYNQVGLSSELLIKGKKLNITRSPSREASSSTGDKKFAVFKETRRLIAMFSKAASGYIKGRLSLRIPPSLS